MCMRVCRCMWVCVCVGGCVWGGGIVGIDASKDTVLCFFGTGF